jgi:transposase-like protein
MTEVSPKAQRRRFTAAYKQKILKEVDACTARGEVGALLRREGLYSSHIAAWRAAQEKGGSANLEPKKRGPKPAALRASNNEADQLRRRVARLEKELGHAHALIEIQKKVASLLGNPMANDDERS